MNDRHPSGTVTTPAPASDDASVPYAPYGGQEAAYGDLTTYGDYAATGFHTGTHTTASFATDPLFGHFSADGAQSTGAYDATQWSTDTQHTLAHDAYAAQHHAAACDTGAYDTTAWATGYQQLAAVPQQSGPVDVSGQWDASAWLQPGGVDQTDPFGGAAQADAAAGHTQQWDWGTQIFDSGAYDATQWNTDGAAGDTTATATVTCPSAPSAHGDRFGETAGYDEYAGYPEYDEYGGPEQQGDTGSGEAEQAATGELPAVSGLLEDQEENTAPPAPRAGSRGAGRSRRRPAKRSALLTVAVPSACVMGVAGIAAASVGGLTDDGKDTSASASDAHPVQPATANNKLDTQLQSLSAGADDFADRASRTQERIDLKAQQEAEKKKAAEEAARKERLRPKFALPVLQRGLSAYFGQAGVNWMSVHTGIDFPVSYGTTVMAATDGTVRTQWNSAYGNMLILTAKDGTETWYCHLSRYQVPPGAVVKAGQPIAYSGNSGNSTGPHLHFEVRPAGGAPIDPLPWLRSHGLDPS
ncbi:M23 family metallopeptidase [Streptomyces spiralis]|uniref:M23 family metallopeptidase n=1 Tax=Streptomyces spiralis TaxID=66376 RepID=UPI0036A351A6